MFKSTDLNTASASLIKCFDCAHLNGYNINLDVTKPRIFYL